MIACQSSNDRQMAIGGDSAGGNLALAVLSHILHPHPQVPKILPLCSPLASAVLISPWVTFDTTADSFRRNGKIDFITAELISYWGVGAMGEGVAEAEIAEDRYHAEAKLAPESWWEGLERVVKFVGMTAGAYETFVDDVTELHRKLKDARRELFVAPREVHDALIFDMDARRPPSEASIKVAEFLHEGFGGP
jgi:acetyl esterase/lipase